MTQALPRPLAQTENRAKYRRHMARRRYALGMVGHALGVKVAVEFGQVDQARRELNALTEAVAVARRIVDDLEADLPLPGRYSAKDDTP